MDTTRINHNNSGHKYRIAVDIAKEGSHIWDLTPYFKGRVGDNNFGLQVTWYYQGQLMNVVGMKPYIEGLVGQYSFGKNGEIDMDPDAVPVRYDGSPDDCEEAGKATFYFPSQMFPKEGIFKGFIGVKDDRDGSKNPQISGVTIWFKVLPGIVQMGHACDAYISDLDKALQNFKERLDEHDQNYQRQLQKVIDDARNTYESETQNAHDAVVAAKAEADATKANQDNLNQLINDTIEYIKSHNIVTLDQYNALSKKIVDRLAQTNFQPGIYPSEAKMKAANPTGSNNICITADTQHKWIYYNDDWLDLGSFNFAPLDPNFKKAALTPNTNNLIANSDFKVIDMIDWGSNNGSQLDYSIDKTESQQGSNVLVIRSTDAEALKWAFLPKVEIKGNKNISFGVKLNVSGFNFNVGWINLVLRWVKGDNTTQDINYQLNNSSDTNFTDFVQTNIAVPTDAVAFIIGVQFQAIATIKLLRPQANFGAKLLKYTSTDPDNKTDLNYIKVQDIKNWTAGLKTPGSSYNQDTSVTFNGLPTCKMNMSETNSPLWDTVNPTEPCQVRPDSKISISLPAMSIHPEGSAVFLQLNQYKADKTTLISSRNYYIVPSTKVVVHNFNNIPLGKDTYYIAFDLAINGGGSINFGQPQINYGAKSVNSTLTDDNPQNLLSGLPFSQWSNVNIPPTTSIEYDYLTGVDGYPLTTIKTTQAGANSWSWKQLDNLSVNASQPLKVELTYSADFDESANQAILRLECCDNQNSHITNIDLKLHPQKVIKKQIFDNLYLPANTAYVNLIFGVQGIAIVKMQNVEAYYTEDSQETAKNNENKLPQMHIMATSPTGDQWQKGRFNFTDGQRTVTGYLKIGIQGASSRNYPKKNFKIKTFSDDKFTKKFQWKPKSTWDPNNKFNLKANWIDATQARNLVNSQLFKNAIAITPFADSTVADNLAHTQSLGMIEGFPIEVYFNDDYQGLYTFNTKKDKVTYGMDDANENHEAIEVDGSLHFDTSQDNLDSANYAPIVHDKFNPEIVANFKKFIDFVNTASADDFKKHFQDYIDLNSCLNLFMFGLLSTEYDWANRSEIFLTYDNGKSFYLVPYDLDSTWGLMWDGSRVDKTWTILDIHSKTDDTNANLLGEFNQIMGKIYTFMKPEMKAQYQFLRKTVWSNAQIINAFQKFIYSIPQEAYERDQKKWPQIPSIKTTSLSQISHNVIMHVNALDKYMENLVPTADPIENLQNEINQLKNGTKK